MPLLLIGEICRRDFGFWGKRIAGIRSKKAFWVETLQSRFFRLATLCAFLPLLLPPPCFLDDLIVGSTNHYICVL